MIDLQKTAVILVGYQNDYFSESGLLHEFVGESIRVNNTLGNTVKLIQGLPESVPIIATPIHFTENYSELVDEPVGILKIVKDVGAFQVNAPGSEMIEDLKVFGDRIEIVEGKRGFNAFAKTDLDEVLQMNDIEHVVIAGAVTSVCIDSTGRYAQELGYQVSILSDCTAAKSVFEQSFYCESIFPVYANVITSEELIAADLVAA